MTDPAVSPPSGSATPPESESESATPDSEAPTAQSEAPTGDEAPAPGGEMPDYKGEPLDAERGPGLGCFWIQIGLLTFFLVFTPLTVTWGWPPVVSAALLIFTLILLLFSGQTIIFLLRLVAVDRRSRRTPLDPAAKPTVGQLEEAGMEAKTQDVSATADTDTDSDDEQAHD
jgi:hypothetical protein